MNNAPPISAPTPPRWRPILLGFGFFTAVGLLLFGSFHLDHLARSNPVPPLIPSSRR